MDNKLSELSKPVVLAELEAKDKRIAELEAIATEYAGKFQKAQDAAKHLASMNASAQAEIAHLKTLLATPVRLPPLMDGELFGKNSATANAHNNAITACSIAIRGAGFKSEATALKCVGDEQ